MLIIQIKPITLYPSHLTGHQPHPDPYRGVNDRPLPLLPLAEQLRAAAGAVHISETQQCTAGGGCEEK